MHTALCEAHNLCSPRDLHNMRNSGPVQRIDLNMVQVVLRHKVDHLRASEAHTIFDGHRGNKVRALQPYASTDHRGAFFKPHDEFVGQGYWRGPYPKGQA